ncbi:MAG: hypothetical protein IPI60_06695 [Saprospiraceae bacterium]|nr:hypothetical protein [Saprospiraceae bacterium]
MSNNRIDDIFKDGLKDAKVTPPDHVWARIQASGVVKPAQNRGVITIMTIRWAAAAAIALLMTVGGFWIFQKESTTSGNLPIAEEKVIPNEQKELQEAESKGTLENTKDESEYAVEEVNTDSHPTLKEDVSSKQQIQQRKSKSPNREDVPQRSYIPEQTPLNQEKETRLAEVELIIPTQKLEITGPKLIQSKNVADNTELASVDAAASKDVAVKFSVDPNALIYAANQLGSQRTVRERLFDKAGEKMTELAEAAGLPVRKWSKIKEVEILY